VASGRLVLRRRGALLRCDSNKTLGKKFLRGYKLPMARNVKFTAVYPGGTTDGQYISICRFEHFSGPRTRFHVAGECCAYTQGEQQKYVTQIYFPDSITEEVYKLSPYDNTRARYNQCDGRIYNRAKNADRGMPEPD